MDLSAQGLVVLVLVSSLYNETRESSVRLADHLSVFSAEHEAIIESLRWIHFLGLCQRSFLCDSVCALQTFQSDSTSARQDLIKISTLNFHGGPLVLDCMVKRRLINC